MVFAALASPVTLLTVVVLGMLAWDLIQRYQRAGNRLGAIEMVIESVEVSG